MKQIIKWGQWLMVIATMLLLINTQFRAIIKNPNTMLFSTGGDALKNYLTPMLHVKNSKTYHHFDSMNYPYGEHVLFTDNQPLLSNFLRFWERNFGEIAYYTIGALNFALLLSLFGAGLLLYAIFRRLELPHWYSLIVAMITTWLSPQLLRFEGHYALAYMFILVLLLYFLLRFEEKTWKWSLAILALVLFAPMLHFYYFGISAVFLSFFYALKVWYNRSTWRFYLQHWALQIFGPFIFLNFVWLKIGNSVIDRPDKPWGFLHYVTVWEGSFLKKGTLLYELIDNYLIKIRSISESESINYIGFVATFFLFSRLLSWLWTRRFRVFEERMPFSQHQYHFVRTVFWAGVLLYLFSMGLPFILPNCESLLAFVGPLKQFRGLGRFAWMFYFVANITAFYAVYQWSERIRNIEFRRAFFFIVLLIGISEARTNSARVKHFSSLYEQLRPTGETIQNWLPKIDTAKYQAILPIPYYHLGAEYIGIEPVGDVLANTMLPSYYSGLPCMGVMMSRTSWQQSLNSMPLGLSFYREPPVLKELPNQKPLLAIEYKQGHVARGESFRLLLNQGKKIHENATFALYELPLDAYRKSIAEYTQHLYKEFEAKKLLTQKDNLLTQDTLVNYVYQHFDESQNVIPYRGKGALSFVTHTPKVVFKDKIPNIRKGQKYKLSFWLNIQKGYHSRTLLTIKELSPNGEQKYLWEHGALHNITTLDGHWAFVDLPFTPQFEDTYFQVTLLNEESAKDNIEIDELLIRPENSSIYKREANEWMYNGKWYSVDNP